MSKIKNWATLQRQLQKMVAAALEDDVAKVVKEVELAHIQSDVLGSYAPAQYQRRQTGGIDDPKNMASYLENPSTLVVENRTPFSHSPLSANSGDDLAGLIEYGDGWNGYHYEYPHEGGADPYNKPRPFLQNTREDLSLNRQHVAALKKGLTKRGVKIW